MTEVEPRVCKGATHLQRTTAKLSSQIELRIVGGEGESGDKPESAVVATEKEVASFFWHPLSPSVATGHIS